MRYINLLLVIIISFSCSMANEKFMQDSLLENKCEKCQISLMSNNEVRSNKIVSKSCLACEEYLITCESMNCTNQCFEFKSETYGGFIGEKRFCGQKECQKRIIKILSRVCHG